MEDKIWGFLQVLVFFILIGVVSIWMRRNDPLEQSIEEEDEDV